MTCCDGCAEGPPDTPLPVDNRPFLPRIATRVGSFGTFRRTMLDRISSRPELDGLTTRDSDDHAIAVLEQWAAVADVLTFYSERYANESYLRTATLDQDAARIVRLIGYRPVPGTSATTTLTFSLTDGAVLDVPQGFAVQSVPGPGQLPQTFETLEDCAGDARLNALPARPAPATVDPLRHPAGGLLDSTVATDLAHQLSVGMPLLLVEAGTPGAVTPSEVAGVSSIAEQVRVMLTAPPAGSTSASAHRARRTLRVFGQDAAATSAPTMTTDSSAAGGVTWSLGSANDLSLSGSSLPLDRQYEDIAVGTQLLLQAAGSDTRIVTVSSTDTQLLAINDASGHAGPAQAVTVLGLSSPLFTMTDRRALRIVELADGPLFFDTQDYAATLGNELWIPGIATADDGIVDAVQVALPIGARTPSPVLSPTDFAAGRVIVVGDGAGNAVATTVTAGVRRDPAGVLAGQRAHLVVPVAAADTDLAGVDPTTAVLWGNAALASHGRTVAGEVIGSGDASQTFQRFSLAKAPLTRVPAAVAAGSVPAIDVTVDAARWPDVPALLAAGSSDEIMELRTDDSGATVVQFGDGVTGARPTTGAGNIVATYRYGAGIVGQVSAGQLTQAAQRPPGFDRVTNPVAAQGGSDPENGTRLRERAPGTVRVIGRAVSAGDCADLLVATALVAKASATTFWDSRGLVIGVSVAAEGGGSLDGSSLVTLAGVVTAGSPPYRRVVVDSYAPVPLTISLGVTQDAQHDGPTVLAAVRAAITAAFSFDAQSLAAPVHLSDVYLAAYTAVGVGNIDVTTLAFRRPDGVPDPAWSAFLDAHGAGTDPTPERLRLLGSRPGPSGAMLPAELVALADDDLVTTLVPAPPAPTTGGLT